MGNPAARVGDMHTCPMSDGLKRHIGGPVLPLGASSNVFIGGRLAATVGTKCMCLSAPDTIANGSKGVFINGKPAARMGDSTAHRGRVTSGLPTVLIGDKCTPCDQSRMANLTTAAQNGTPFARKF
jgi:uncharacterized Zn-binding protein involved in type VI secretion